MGTTWTKIIKVCKIIAGKKDCKLNGRTIWSEEDVLFTFQACHEVSVASKPADEPRGGNDEDSKEFGPDERLSE